MIYLSDVGCGSLLNLVEQMSGVDRFIRPVPGDNAMPCWRQPAGGWLVGTSVHAVPRLPHGDRRCAQDFIVTDPPYGVRVSDLVFRETLGQ